MASFTVEMQFLGNKKYLNLKNNDFDLNKD